MTILDGASYIERDFCAVLAMGMAMWVKHISARVLMKSKNKIWSNHAAFISNLTTIIQINFKYITICTIFSKLKLLKIISENCLVNFQF